VREGIDGISVFVEVFLLPRDAEPPIQHCLGPCYQLGWRMCLRRLCEPFRHCFVWRIGFDGCSESIGRDPCELHEPVIQNQ